MHSQGIGEKKLYFKIGVTDICDDLGKLLNEFHRIFWMMSPNLRYVSLNFALSICLCAIIPDLFDY